MNLHSDFDRLRSPEAEPSRQFDSARSQCHILAVRKRADISFNSHAPQPASTQPALSQPELSATMSLERGSVLSQLLQADATDVQLLQVNAGDQSQNVLLKWVLALSSNETLQNGQALCILQMSNVALVAAPTRVHRLGKEGMGPRAQTILERQVCEAEQSWMKNANLPAEPSTWVQLANAVLVQWGGQSPKKHKCSRLIQVCHSATLRSVTFNRKACIIKTQSFLTSARVTCRWSWKSMGRPC